MQEEELFGLAQRAAYALRKAGFQALPAYRPKNGLLARLMNTELSDSDYGLIILLEEELEEVYRETVTGDYRQFYNFLRGCFTRMEAHTEATEWFRAWRGWIVSYVEYLKIGKLAERAGMTAPQLSNLISGTGKVKETPERVEAVERATRELLTEMLGLLPRFTDVESEKEEK